MKLRIIDESFLENLPEVTSNKIMLNKRFHPEGLFSEQIFGPIQSYRCWCKDVKVPTEEVCPECGIRITSSSMRRKQYAKIDVGKIIHPIIWELIQNVKQWKVACNKFLKAETFITSDYEIMNLTEASFDLPNAYYGFDAVEYYFKGIILNAKKANVNSKVINFLDEAIESGKFFTKYVVVIPPDLRPVTNDGKGMDELNNVYLSILDYKLKDTVIKTFDSYIKFQGTLQDLAHQVTATVLEKLGKKTGLLRNKLEGKRVDFSGRAVISVDPNIPITHAKISRHILLRLWQLDIANVLYQQGKFVTFKAAIDYIEEQIKDEEIEPEIKQLIDKLSTDKLVILNRQPTLHRGSMIAFRVIPEDSYVIRINPLVCEPFNADFDGDQMAIHRPLGDLAVKEAEKMLAPYNYLDPANGKFQFKPKQDIVYGIYKLSQTKTGRGVIAKALQLDIDDIPENLSAKQLNELLEQQVQKDYRVLDSIKTVGFGYTLKHPVTMSIMDFDSSKIKLTGDREKDKEILDNELEKKKSKFKFKDFIESGARASWDQAKQLIVARGYVSDFFGKIVPKGISSSFANGLTQEEFFISAFGTRKGLLDVAENTAESGYLTRRLVYTGLSARISSKVEDCGSKITLPVYIEDEDMAKMFVYRYYYEADPLKNDAVELKYIDENNYHEIVGKTIFLRSPMTCRSPHICKTCYGGLYDKIKAKHVGVIAAQSLGERSTQLVLRTFHTSGVAQGKGLKKQEDIVSALQQVEAILDSTFEVEDRFHMANVCVDLYHLFKNYGKIHFVHYEVINAQRHRNSEGKRWRLSERPLEDYGKMISLKQAPGYESWFLGIIFQNIRNVVNGLFASTNASTPLEKIALGEF